MGGPGAWRCKHLPCSEGTGKKGRQVGWSHGALHLDYCLSLHTIKGGPEVGRSWFRNVEASQKGYTRLNIYSKSKKPEAERQRTWVLAKFCLRVPLDRSRGSGVSYAGDF